MKRSVLKKAFAWTTPDGGAVELSKGYPLSESISLARFSLSDTELSGLVAEFNSLLVKRESERNQQPAGQE